jgi:hypothetical protein
MNPPFHSKCLPIPLPTVEEAAHGWRLSRSFIVALCDEVNSTAPLGLVDEETAEQVVLALVRSGYVTLRNTTH